MIDGLWYVVRVLLSYKTAAIMPN